MEVLAILQKWEDMAEYVYIAIRLYPKSERHVLAAETLRALLDLGTNLQMASTARSRDEKRYFVEEADRSLARMRILVRLAFRLAYIPEKKREVLCGYIAEVGKMLGGWKKSVSGTA